MTAQVEQFLLKTHSECRCAAKFCERLKIYKISEGLYRIGDRNVFIRVCLYNLLLFIFFICFLFLTTVSFCSSLRIVTLWSALVEDGM